MIRLGILLLIVEAAGLAWSRRVLRSSPHTGQHRVASWAAMAVGAALGLAAALKITSRSEDLKLWGFPFPAGRLAFENGTWVHLTTDWTLPLMSLDFVAAYLLPVTAMQVLVAARALRRRGQ